MSSARLPLSILAALIGLMIVQMVYFFPQLPENVASHFDGAGVPNGWMNKTMYVVIIMFATLMSVGSTAAFAILMPRLQSSINISNKEYWLSPERRDSTVTFIAHSLLWIGCAVAMLLLVVNHFVCQFNIDSEKTLALPMIPTLMAFFGMIAFIIGRMILKFRKRV